MMGERRLIAWDFGSKIKIFKAFQLGHFIMGAVLRFQWTQLFQLYTHLARIVDRPVLYCHPTWFLSFCFPLCRESSLLFWHIVFSVSSSCLSSPCIHLGRHHVPVDVFCSQSSKKSFLDFVVLSNPMCDMFNGCFVIALRLATFGLTKPATRRYQPN